MIYSFFLKYWSFVLKTVEIQKKNIIQFRDWNTKIICWNRLLVKNIKHTSKDKIRIVWNEWREFFLSVAWVRGKYIQMKEKRKYWE